MSTLTTEWAVVEAKFVLEVVKLCIKQKTSSMAMK